MEIQTDQDVEILRSDVVNFKNIDNEIAKVRTLLKPLQTRLKELNSKKKELQQEICLTLSKNNMIEVELQDSGYKIEFLQKQAVIPLTQSAVKEKIMDFFEKGPGSKIQFNSLTSSDKGNKLIEYLYSKENRQYISKDVLKPVS